MSLKQEIEKELALYNQQKQGKFKDIIAPSNEEIFSLRIFKLFEKRIDSVELWCGECNDKALEKFRELLK